MISPLLQLNSDLQPFVKNSVGEPVSFSFGAAPVVFHRQIVGQERWHQQLQQVGEGQAMTPPAALFSSFLDHASVCLVVLHTGRAAKNLLIGKSNNTSMNTCLSLCFVD